jgi:hypothetical protein
MILTYNQLINIRDQVLEDATKEFEAAPMLKPLYENNLQFYHGSERIKIPDLPGVYAIARKQKLEDYLYVGESSNINKRLRKHFRKQGGSSLRKQAIKCGLFNDKDSDDKWKEFYLDSFFVKYFLLPIGRLELEKVLQSKYGTNRSIRK